MSNWNNNNDTECRTIAANLPEYIENLLSARSMIEVESHLTHCIKCAMVCRQLQTTVELLQSAHRFETSDDFMMKLHSKLDTAQPDRSLHLPSLTSIRDMISNTLRSRTAPILSAGVVMAGVVAFALLYHPIPKSSRTMISTHIGVEQPLQRNVALAAVNPFDDPIAANLEAHSAIQDNNAITASNEE